MIKKDLTKIKMEDLFEHDANQNAGMKDYNEVELNMYKKTIQGILKFADDQDKSNLEKLIRMIDDILPTYTN